MLAQEVADECDQLVPPFHLHHVAAHVGQGFFGRAGDAVTVLVLKLLRESLNLRVRAVDVEHHRVNVGTKHAGKAKVSCFVGNGKFKRAKVGRGVVEDMHRAFVIRTLHVTDSVGLLDGLAQG
ncbi:MAG: hypothetical protein BWY57_03546 [Betaproteobacteria bacterium ADurb.Bin341]|nr:MAG: hypothetical protein BWY57_03546 [Betaproteobacteria bacterium ADurb.Bin341]